MAEHTHDMHAGHTHTHHQEEVQHTTQAHDHSGHGGAHVDHTGHEMMFRSRFWVSLLLTIPVLLFSPML
jgi:Cu2+-exporting ATPase